MIKIKVSNNDIYKFVSGINPLQIIKNHLPNLQQIVIAAIFNDKIIDLNTSLYEDGILKFLTCNHSESLKILNHSVAHLMLHALTEMYPQILSNCCYSDKKSFYYDIDFQDIKISKYDFLNIEQKMRQITAQKLNIIREEISYEEAYKFFYHNPYKILLLKKLKNQKINVYKQGSFFDLCTGLQITNTIFLKYFKLLKISGAYVSGNDQNKQITRIYGTSFFTEQALTQHLKLLEKQKYDDHKNINKKLNFFMFSPEVGLGFPFWLSKGAVVRRIIERYIVDKELSYGYEHVYTPILANTNIYSISGHLEHYHKNMFPFMEMSNGEKLVLRPMNCPHHMMIYKRKIYSYKELPVKIAEMGMMHRLEKSGAVSGLERVREMTLNDAHIFVRFEQIKDEFKKIIYFIQEVYRDFDITDYFFRLSYRDPLNKKKYFDDDDMWNQSEKILKEIMIEMNLKFVEITGEAAFYGPKLDVQVKTALEHEETLSSVQIDFLLPKRFNLSYVAEDGKFYCPILIHRCIISTIERFFAYLLERYKGFFPLWLAPVQMILIPINGQNHLQYAQNINSIFLKHGFRTEINIKDVNLNYKIKEAQQLKIPYQIVIGDKEIEKNLITVREYQQNTVKSMLIKDFLIFLKKKIIQK